MSGRHKVEKSSAKAKSKSTRDSLQFPMGHLLRFWNYVERIWTGVPENLAAVLEYLVAKVVEWAGNTALEFKKTCVILRYLNSNFGHFRRYHHLALVKIGQQ
ncbi:hypothetical protein ACTXT7_016270 [Hymenolepis weldensis]